MSKGKPLATMIRRWFLAADKGTLDGSEIQVLVISKVGQKVSAMPVSPAMSRLRPTPTPNAVARKVADTIAPDFACRQAEPKWHGRRGNPEFEPMRSFGG